MRNKKVSWKFAKMFQMRRTETCPVLLGFPKLQFFYLCLFNGFWSTLPTFRAFLFKVPIMPREPDVPDDQVQFVEGQFTLWR